MRHQPATPPSLAQAATAAAPGTASTTDAAPGGVARSARARAMRVVRRLDWPVVLVAVAALALNLYRLGTPSIWFDEAFSAELSRLPVRAIWGAFTTDEPNMVFYYLVLHEWLRLMSALGIAATEFVVRFPSAIFAAASSVMVLLLGRRYVSLSAGLVGAALFVLSGWQLTYAQQTRGYSLQVLLLCIAWYALLAVLRGTRHPARWWVVYTVASVLAFYAQLFSALVILAQAIVFGCLFLLPTSWRAEVRRHLVGMVVSLVAVGLSTTPFIIVSRTSHTPAWLPSPEAGELFHKIFASPTRAIAVLLFAAVMVAGLVVLAITRLPAVARRMERRGLDARRMPLFTLPGGSVPALIGLAGWLLIPTVTSYFVSQGSLRLFSSRYLVAIVPALCLLGGAIVVSISWRWARIAAIVAVIGVSLILLPRYYANAQVEDWRTPAHWIETRYQPNDGLICYNSIQGCQESLQFELHADRAAFDFAPDAPGYISLANYGTNVDPFKNWGLASNPGTIATYAAKHPRMFYVLGRLTSAGDLAYIQKTVDYMNAHYRLIDRYSNGAVTVLLYDTQAG